MSESTSSNKKKPMKTYTINYTTTPPRWLRRWHCKGHGFTLVERIMVISLIKKLHRVLQKAKDDCIAIEQYDIKSIVEKIEKIENRTEQVHLYRLGRYVHVKLENKVYNITLMKI